MSAEDLGPLPEPARRAHGFTYRCNLGPEPDLFTAAQMEAERKRCYELGAAQERERWAKLCDSYQPRSRRHPEDKGCGEVLDELKAEGLRSSQAV